MSIKKSVLAGVFALASTSVMAEERVLNVYNWWDYIKPEIIQNFSKETGIKVNYDVYDTNEILEAKLMAGNSGFDIVVPSGAFLERQIKAGIHTELDKSKLTNYSNLDTTLLKTVTAHDAGNKHSVPYAWGTVGLAYNVDMLKERLGDRNFASLDLLFDPEVSSKLKDCGIGFIDSPSEVMSIALNYLGLDPNSEDTKDLKLASDLIKKNRKNIRHFNTGALVNDLVNGNLCLAIGYNGDMLRAQKRADEAGKDMTLKYSIPVEGTVAWFDLLAIPKDAKNKEAAYQFIDYLLKPENAAAISNFVLYAVPNTKVDDLLDEAVRTNEGICPSADVKKTLFSLKAHGAKFDRKLTRAWTNIKLN